ncbi:response regulator transcription factor [Desulfitibacter alkalitolerans]|uniref:response regulator transcription factor n=1 Tax=Desulfitibacter alkalitolerans TaxID=264641 RepID=UPI000557B194|nr:response regulator transcription factor [Desulfitibacter alkalitolerans]
MTIPNILIVDDEEGIRDLVEIYIKKEGYNAHKAANSKEALEKIKTSAYDLFIVDVMMPGLDGFGLVKEIRKFNDKPIIMLTAKGEEYERILGFELGCDDYVVKPFSPRELAHRVKALLKRTLPGDKQEKTLKFPRLVIDHIARKVEVDNQEVSMTPKEFNLLYYLASSPGRVFTREQILEAIWGYDFFGDLRTVDTHVKKLREKLGRDNGPDYLSTVWGVGYKFEVPQC